MNVRVKSKRLAKKRREEEEEEPSRKKKTLTASEKKNLMAKQKASTVDSEDEEEQTEEEEEPNFNDFGKANKKRSKKAQPLNPVMDGGKRVDLTSIDAPTIEGNSIKLTFHNGVYTHLDGSSAVPLRLFDSRKDKNTAHLMTGNNKLMVWT